VSTITRFEALVNVVIPQINTLPCFKPPSITSETSLCKATVSNNASSFISYYRALQPFYPNKSNQIKR